MTASDFCHILEKLEKAYDGGYFRKLAHRSMWYCTPTVFLQNVSQRKVKMD